MPNDKNLVRRQTHGALAVCLLHKERLAARLAATRKLFGPRVCAVDIHSHSTYSDGCSTVAQNVERATELSGLDFLFVTDHDTLTQRRAVAKFPRAGLGQETFGADHHVGMLAPTKVHHGCPTLAQTLDEARALAPFVWVAHPVDAIIADDPAAFEARVAEIAPLGDIAIEVLNGFVTIDHVYPGSRGHVKLFDRLLTMGRRVTPLAGSDAHGLVEFGGCWTGVHGARATAPSIIKALSAGRCFASESPILDFACNGSPMGSVVRAVKGTPLTFTIRAADSYGLQQVRIISGGKVVKQFRPCGDTVLAAEWTRAAGASPSYYRLEVIADDSRRAFSAPIYITPSN